MQDILTHNKFSTKRNAIAFLRKSGTLVGKELHLPIGIRAQYDLGSFKINKNTIKCSKEFVPENVITYKEVLDLDGE